MTGVLLDTCAVIWMSQGLPLAPHASSAITVAALARTVHVSPVSAWEIGLLAVRGRLTEVQTPFAAHQWFTRFMARSGIVHAPLTAAAAIDSAYLPGLDHRDPADRFLIATARQLDVPVVTRDRKIIDYARTGHVKCIAC